MSKSTKKSAKSGAVIRIATVKSGALVRVTRQGMITDARLAKRHGVKQFRTWTEVAADSWAKATAAFRAGKGSKGSVARKAA